MLEGILDWKKFLQYFRGEAQIIYWSVVVQIMMMKTHPFDY